MSSGARRILVLIASDRQAVRARVRRLLESITGYAVAGEAASAADAVRAARQKVPDILLLDFTPTSSALDALMELGEGSTRIRPVLLTENLDRVHTIRALQLGARAVVLRESAPEMLDEAIQAVAGGQYWIGRNTAGDLVSTLKRLGAHAPRRPRAPFGLTQRQVEITLAVAAGLSNGEIAQTLGIPEATVKGHVAEILVKTGAASRLELAMLALRHDLHQSR